MNLIHNGLLQVWQKGTSFVSPDHYSLIADRYRWGHFGNGRVTITRSANTPSPQVPYSMRFEVTTPVPSLSSGEDYHIRQVIEGYNLTPVWGEQMGLSFKVFTNVVGTYSIACTNLNVTHTYVGEYKVYQANVWESKIVPIPLSPPGSWNFTNDIGLKVRWDLGNGSTYQTNPGQWLAGNYTGSVNQTNFMSTQGNIFHIADIQLVPLGKTCENPSFSETLRICQRYFCKSYDYEDTPGTFSGKNLVRTIAHSSILGSTSGPVSIQNVNFPTELRTVPQVTIYKADGVQGNVTLQNGSIVKSGVSAVTNMGTKSISILDIDASSPQPINDNDQIAFHYTADAEF